MNPLFANLPGQDLVEQALADLAAGEETVPALLVLAGYPRFERLRLAEFPPREIIGWPHRRLYRLLAADHGDEAHSRYNALMRRLVSFQRALEHRVKEANRTRPRQRRMKNLQARNAPISSS